MTSAVLGGCRILVVEDNAPLSVFLEKLLRDAGADVVGPAPTISAAEKLAREHDDLSAAILDIRLHGGGEAWPVARILASKNVPFLFYTGHYDSKVLPPEWADYPVLTKPSRPHIILNALAHVVGFSPETRPF